MSWFVQITVSPGSTSKRPGTNSKPLMRTVCVFPDGAELSTLSAPRSGTASNSILVRMIDLLVAHPRVRHVAAALHHACMLQVFEKQRLRALQGGLECGILRVRN